MAEFDRVNIASGAPMEEKAGYSRAVKVGPFVYVGGTTSTHSDGTVEGVGDPYLQSKIIFEKIVEALGKAGAEPKDVTRVGMYVTDISMGKEVIRAYSEVFKPFKPACIMYEVVKFFRPEQLVEIEVDAILGQGDPVQK